MSREYRRIKQYEKEILELRESGLTHREIGERLGFDKAKIKDFFKRYHKKQRKISEGIVIKPKGRPRKEGTSLPPSVQQLSKLTQVQPIFQLRISRIFHFYIEKQILNIKERNDFYGKK